QLNQLKPVPARENPFQPSQPFTIDVCHSLQLGPSGSPFDPAGSFILNGQTISYGSPGAATNQIVLDTIAACDGTPPLAPFPGISFDLNFLRPYQGVGQITSIQNVASSIYNSLQVTLRHRQGPLEVAASYTYGHSLDTASDRFESTFVDSYDLRANRASSDFDQRHLLNLVYMYKLPIVEKVHFINSLLGGEEPGGGGQASGAGSPSVFRSMFNN